MDPFRFRSKEALSILYQDDDKQIVIVDLDHKFYLISWDPSGILIQEYGSFDTFNKALSYYYSEIA